MTHCYIMGDSLRAVTPFVATLRVPIYYVYISLYIRLCLCTASCTVIIYIIRYR